MLQKNNQTPLSHVLKNALFVRLWVSQMFSQFASNMLIFLLALVVYRTTGSNVAVSGLFLAYGFPSLLFGVMAGTIVDRLDRRSVLLVAHLLRALLLIVVSLAGDTIVFLYVLVFLYAVLTQMTMPSEVPLIPLLVPKSQIVSANSLFAFTFYSAVAVGFVSAGPFLRFLGRDGSYAVLFVCFCVSAIAVLGLPRYGEGIRSLKRLIHYDFSYIVKRFFGDMALGIAYVTQSNILREAVVLLTGTQITLVLLGTLGPGFADKVLRIDVRDASLLIVGPTVLGIVLGALWVGNHGYRFASRILMNVGILSAGIILISTAAVFGATNLLWFSLVPRWMIHIAAFVLFFLLGVANSFLDVPSNSILQRETEGSMRGRVYGILSASVGGAGIIPVVISAVLADVIGVGFVIALLGVGVLSYGIVRITRYRFTQNSIQ